jgi:uridine kinase
MNCTVIGVAGGTGSGKSTFTNRLKHRFGDQISVIYHDSYYRAHDDIPLEDRAKLNYDHPDSLETDLLIEHIKALKAGHAVEVPVYDFTVHNRKPETEIVLPSPVIVVEGILALQDQRLRSLMDIKVFVDADADERILRRVLRDVEERGRDIHGIISQYLTTVKPMHYTYVEPTRHLADIVLNSGKNYVAFDLVSAKIDELLKSSTGE